jgi:hypothetical protein
MDKKMRINIYAEEITEEAEVVRKTVNQEQFYGVRLFLKSPKELHYGTSDDDRSAITLWVPWTKEHGHQPGIVLIALENMLEALTTEAKLRERRENAKKNPNLGGPGA